MKISGPIRFIKLTKDDVHINIFSDHHDVTNKPINKNDFAKYMKKQKKQWKVINHNYQF